MEEDGGGGGEEEGGGMRGRPPVYSTHTYPNRYPACIIYHRYRPACSPTPAPPRPPSGIHLV